MRLIRVTHPDPCQPITFHDRVAVNRCRLGHRTMIIVNTLAIRPEPQPMIRAFNGISDKLSLREGSKSVGATVGQCDGCPIRSEEHTSELQSLMHISYAVFCLKTKSNYR